MKKIKTAIINTGGTFSKEYNKITGKLEVNCDKINSFIPNKHSNLLMEDLIMNLHISPSIELTYYL